MTVRRAFPFAEVLRGAPQSSAHARQRFRGPRHALGGPDAPECRVRWWPRADCRRECLRPWASARSPLFLYNHLKPVRDERRHRAGPDSGGVQQGVCWLLKGSFYVTRFTEKTHKSTGQGVPWGTRVPDSVELSRTNYSHACRLPSGAPKMPNGPPWPTPGASCDSWTG